MFSLYHIVRCDSEPLLEAGNTVVITKGDEVHELFCYYGYKEFDQGYLPFVHDGSTSVQTHNEREGSFVQYLHDISNVVEITCEISG